MSTGLSIEPIEVPVAAPSSDGYPEFDTDADKGLRPSGYRVEPKRPPTYRRVLTGLFAAAPVFAAIFLLVNGIGGPVPWFDLALLAFFALTNVDIVVARNVLPPREAGLYAAGLILVKAVLFLPQFVVVLAFPAMASDPRRRRALLLSTVVVLGVGMVVVLPAAEADRAATFLSERQVPSWVMGEVASR